MGGVTISYVNYDDGYGQNCGCGFTLPITTVVSNVVHGDMPDNYENCLSTKKLNILENVCCNKSMEDTVSPP